MRRALEVSVFLALTAVLAAGCTGGTRATGGTAPNPITGGGGLILPDPLATAQPATNFLTAEFSRCYTATSGATYCAYGLGQIGAEYAYAKGAYGGGVTVAVIDTGIDPTHPELAANISPDSIDIVRGGTLTDLNGHGTHVSGIIGAVKNGAETHGVAFNATILAIRADSMFTDPTCVPAGSACKLGFSDADLANALIYAAGRAHVINMSLGGPSPVSAAFVAALENAAAAGAIIVMATGNDGAANPSWPAAYAGDATVNASGQLIAVAAVDSTGTIAIFSNQCGSAMNYCLVAPGVDIVSTVPGGMAVMSGTSQATPFVSGAAALLVQAFPSLTPAQVVQILLTTATDLGAAGVDAVYGHGLLNLNAAMLPVGTVVIPLSGSASAGGAALNGTMLVFGGAFGDALAGNVLLTQAFALDSFDRPYLAGLDTRVVRPGRGFGLAALDMTGGVRTVETALPFGMSLTAGVPEADGTNPLWDDKEEPLVAPQGLSLSGGLGDASEFSLGMDVTPEQQLGGIAATDEAGLYWMAGDLLSPQYALVGAGNGFSFSSDLGDRGRLSLGLVDQSGTGDGSGGDARIGEIALDWRIGDSGALRASLDLIDEAGGFLGSDTTGAFSVDRTVSQSYGLGGSMPLGGGVSLLANYTIALATVAPGAASLLSDWSDMTADAYGVGISRTGVFSDTDSLGLLVGQPLRIRAGEATLTAPVGYTLDKTVIQQSGRVSLVPSGREIDLQLAYRASLGPAAGLSTWLMMQTEPGNIADAPPAYGVGLRFQAGF